MAKYTSEIKSFGEIPTSQVIIVGAEDLEFIQAFAQFYPQKEIFVFDTKSPEALCTLKNVSYFIENSMDRIFQSDFFDFVLKNLPVVVTAQNSWKGREQDLSLYFSVFTGRNPKSFETHLMEFGFDIKALPVKKGLLSIKDLFASLDPKRLQQVPELLILKELVR